MNQAVLNKILALIVRRTPNPDYGFDPDEGLLPEEKVRLLSSLNPEHRIRLREETGRVFSVARPGAAENGG